MTKDEALKLALEALEYHTAQTRPIHQTNEAITAIKEALAQQEQCQCPNCKVTLHASDCAVHSGPAYPAGGCDCGAQQKSVAWEQFYPDMGKPKLAYLPPTESPENACYTAPSTWVGLTDEEILVKCESVPDYDIGNHDLIQFARAIEAKLKAKNT